MSDKMKCENGTVLKGIAGFYYVETESGIITCKARGKFRKQKITPLVGDKVTVMYEDMEDGVVSDILNRRNSLVRPPISNIDKLFIVVSLVDPSPNLLVIDKTIALSRLKDIEPIILINKTDLKDSEEFFSIYKDTGIKCIEVCGKTGMGVEEIRPMLKNCISAFTGNSGVGKSTLLNYLYKDLDLETGEISKKLGRGRHTTRHVELFKIDENAYVADTPGFSSLDFDIFDPTLLQHGFIEFEPYLFTCKFNSCTHTCEKGCAVLKAVEDGKIQKSRIASYISIYDSIKDVKAWKNLKNV